LERLLAEGAFLGIIGIERKRVKEEKTAILFPREID
jgi:hypothetical protein